MGGPGSCRVCAHPDRSTIDRRLGEGASTRGLARELGLPESTLRLHAKRCKRGRRSVRPMAERRTPEPPSAFDLPDIPEVADEDLAAILAGHKRDHAALQLEYARALSFDEKGEPLESGDPRLVPQLSKELRQNRDRLIAWLSKVEKPKPPEERLLEHRDFNSAVALIVLLLDDFPEARERIRSGLEERLGGPVPEGRLFEHPIFKQAIAFVVQLLDDFPEARERIRQGLEERFGVPA